MQTSTSFLLSLKCLHTQLKCSVYRWYYFCKQVLPFVRIFTISFLALHKSPIYHHLSTWGKSQQMQTEFATGCEIQVSLKLKSKFLDTEIPIFITLRDNSAVLHILYQQHCFIKSEKNFLLRVWYYSLAYIK